MKTILGYSDKIGVCVGESLSFMISSERAAPFSARIVRLIHGDTNPEGPGYREELLQTLGDSYSGRRQVIHAGSHIVVPASPAWSGLSSFTVQLLAWPTTPQVGEQSLLSLWDHETGIGFQLIIDAHGAAAIRIGLGEGRSHTLSSGKALLAREWYMLAAQFDAATGTLGLVQRPFAAYGKTDDAAIVTMTLTQAAWALPAAPLVMAAAPRAVERGLLVVGAVYNGKLEAPRLVGRALDMLEIERLLTGGPSAFAAPDIIGAWDFSKGIEGEVVYDLSPNRLHGETRHLPARAMKGHNWTGAEMSWRHAPDQYGAIHFHDDDLYDAGWESDLTWTAPAGTRSGLYALHVQDGVGEDYIPFAIRPPKGTRTADLLYIMPIASYMAYANEHMATDAPMAERLADQLVRLNDSDLFLAEHREYGNSCYDVHSDGSGVCYSSRLRPIITMRPKYESWLGGKGSSLWQYNADTHITDWFEHEEFPYDCITDEDVHAEGASVLKGYRVIVTSTHHEYWSKEMRDALEAFKAAGGRLIYLGANGWYWRIAYHNTKPGVIEVRRTEGGIRAWAAEPGEYYHSFTGEYGGLWRRAGYPPQTMAGTGFTAQGFDISSYYRRQPDSFDPRAAFIFEGVGEEELIGDFGLIGGGAAGLELDRMDRALGSPPNTLLLASSEKHTDVYLLVPEELLINYPDHNGTHSPLVRADMTFFETPAGGAVFATSSIAWAGSLSHNGYDNNVSRITGNVLRRFLSDEKF
jgi:N,N-dimethylformamidase